jgi:hypothetical protein
MQPSGGRVLISLSLFHTTPYGRLLQRVDAATGLLLRAARRALASQVPLQPECGALPCLAITTYDPFLYRSPRSWCRRALYVR